MGGPMSRAEGTLLAVIACLPIIPVLCAIASVVVYP